MTEANRAQHIAEALSQYNQQAGQRDTMRVPLRSGMLLEVIELPLDLPVLNAESFRIAPALAEHPKAETIRADPYSATAQRVVADLVRDSHRSAEDLKDSLLEGQDQPGLITRKGKLVNGNTRCVLLRELRAEGQITTSTIRVAVLPADVVESQELELESVLQKQIEHKDAYNLVSELMMLKKLHESAGMTDAAIARRLRMRSGGPRVTDLRAVLDLMERARRLTEPTLPLTAFINERDQAQNWLELLFRVREFDQHEGRLAGDLVISRWLIAYMLGFDSVHKLRHAFGAWVEDDVLPDLAEGGDIAATIAEAVSAPAPEPATPVRRPAGVDVLGDEPPPPVAESTAVRRLLNLAVAATRAGDGDVPLDGGKTVPAPDVRDALAGSVFRGLQASKRRSLAGNKLQRPSYGLTQARAGLREALDALDEVGDLPEFLSHRDNVLALIDEVDELLEKVTEAVQEHDAEAALDD